MVTIKLNCGFESLIIIIMQLGISSTDDIPDSYTQNSHGIHGCFVSDRECMNEKACKAQLDR